MTEAWIVTSFDPSNDEVSDIEFVADSEVNARSYIAENPATTSCWYDVFAYPLNSSETVETFTAAFGDTDHMLEVQ